MDRLKDEYYNHENFIMLSNNNREVLLKTNIGHIRHLRNILEEPLKVKYDLINFWKPVKSAIELKTGCLLKTSDIDKVSIERNNIEIQFSVNSPMFFGTVKIIKEV